MPDKKPQGMDFEFVLPTPAQPEQAAAPTNDNRSLIQKYGPSVVRVAGPMVGAGLGLLTAPVTGPAGTIAGGMLGGGASEYLAQKMEGSPISGRRIAVETVAGGLPGRAYVKGGKALASAARSGAIAEGRQMAGRWAEGKSMLPTTAEEVKQDLTAMGTGGTIGAVAGRFTKPSTTPPPASKGHLPGASTTGTAATPQPPPPPSGPAAQTTFSTGQFSAPPKGKKPQTPAPTQKDWEQEARNLNERDKYLKNKTAQDKIELEKAGMKAQKPSITESTRAQTPTGTASWTQKFQAPKKGQKVINLDENQGPTGPRPGSNAPPPPPRPRPAAPAQAAEAPLPPPNVVVKDVTPPRVTRPGLPPAPEVVAPPSTALATRPPTGLATRPAPEIPPQTTSSARPGLPEGPKPPLALPPAPGKARRPAKTVTKAATQAATAPTAPPTPLTRAVEPPPGAATPGNVATGARPGPTVASEPPKSVPKGGSGVGLGPDFDESTLPPEIQAKLAYARANYPPEVVKKIEELGPQYRTAQGVERSALGAMLSYWEREGKKAVAAREAQKASDVLKGKGPTVVPEPPTTPPSGPEVPPTPPPPAGGGAAPPKPSQTAAATAAAAAKRNAAKAAGKAEDAATVTGLQEDLQQFENKSPEEVKSIIQRMMGETGAVNPMIPIRIMTGGLGALTGATATPEHPWEGAAAGGLAGAFAPEIVRGIRGQGIDPSMGKGLTGALEATKERLPNFQRFNYLSNPSSLLANSIVGPAGSGVMGSIEQGLSGNKEGWKALGNMGPTNFFRNFYKAKDRAVQLLQDASENERAATRVTGPLDWKNPRSIGEHFMEIPAIAMTSGDEGVRTILTDSGIPKDVARRITLTSEPLWAFSRWIMNANRTKTAGGKAAFAASLMLPFKRTALNVLEQGLERTPLVGFMAQQFKDAPDPWRQQLVQQGLGAAVWVAAEQIGESVDPETAKVLRKFVSNAGGQYSLVAAAGFATGQAARAGRATDLLGAMNASFGSVMQDTPLPATDVFMDYKSSATKVLQGNPDNEDITQLLPRGMVPGFMLGNQGPDLRTAIDWLMSQQGQGQVDPNAPAFSFER